MRSEPKQMDSTTLFLKKEGGGGKKTRQTTKPEGERGWWKVEEAMTCAETLLREWEADGGAEEAAAGGPASASLGGDLEASSKMFRLWT